MITVRFFASLRERLGTGELQLPVDGAVTVAALIEQLAADRGAEWREALNAPQLIVAVNQQVAERTASVREGDEVALFPPVTGG